MPTTLTADDPRVWIGCLACYNDGRLTGEWYDADTADLVTPEDLHPGGTDHEELWVMDHDGFLGLLDGECSPSEAAALAEVLAEIPSFERQPFAAWFSVYGGGTTDLTAALCEFRDAFCGEWPSEAHYAQEHAESGLDEQEKEIFTRWPFNALDWERAADELFSSGYDSEDAPGGGIYVFYVC
ncbi:antirestriction protein ArdA [Kitasatospora sp. NPDC059463]|uniref:antirestriction protein ArdA n=1 Tax=unclassified Kitasatospora TaxID=2633591 RepID=UPI00369E860A